MKRFRQFIMLIVSLSMVLLPKVIVNACGFYPASGEYRFWMLQPDLTNSKDLSPFFFASTYLYKGDQYAIPQTYVQQNINEWFTQVRGSSVVKADIDSLLNHTDPDYFFEATRHLSQTNSFFRYLVQPKNAELYTYFLLSKKVEGIAANPDPWGESSSSVYTINKVIGDLSLMIRKSKSSFIKLRAAYQLIRLYNLNGQHDKLAAAYAFFVAPVETNSWIKSATLYQRAISDTGRRDYLLSKVFDRGDYNRVSCLVRFNSADYKKTLLHAKNKHERTVINAMKVFNYPGRSLSKLQTIYNTEPDYKELPFLLLREINKVEDWLVTNKVTGFSPAVYNGEYYRNWDYNAAVNYSQDEVYARRLYAFINRMISERKNSSVSLLHLYAAHLSMLQNNFQVSLRHLALVKEKGQPANVRTQVRLNKFLLKLQVSKHIDRPIENELINILQTPDSKLAIFDVAIMKDQLILFTARKMIEKGEKAKGLMLLSKTRRALGMLPIGQYKRVYQEIEEIAQPADYDRMLQILSSKHQSRFEKFVSNGLFGSPQQYYEYYDGWDTTRWDKNKLLDGKASCYIRHNNLTAALQTMQHIPDSFYSKEPYVTYIGGDPFYLNVYNAHKISKEERLNLNKKSVVREMIRLQNEAKRNPAKRAACYYKLANAWYNMSYYGKNWLMVKQWWSSDEVSTYNRDIKRSAFNDVYFGSTQARAYYLKAMKQTKDKKLLALCCFMAGECNRNFQEYVWTTRNIRNRDARFSSVSNPFAKALKKKSPERNYYDEIVNECATYASYVRKYSGAR